MGQLATCSRAALRVLHCDILPEAPVRHSSSPVPLALRGSKTLGWLERRVSTGASAAARLSVVALAGGTFL